MAGLNFLTFNQDHSLLAVATTRGLRLWTTDPFELSSHSYDDDITLVEPLFSTSLVAMILTPRLLRIVNTRRQSTICELSFHGMVVAVRMNRKRLVVIIEELTFVYDIGNMRLLHQQSTPLNPAGICALSPSSDNNYLAIPHCQKTPPNPQMQPSHVPRSVVKEAISGDVLLYDLNKMDEVTVIQAHQTPVSCLAINNEGTLLATSSEKGTVIRIFSIPDGKKVFQFRRGSIPARIYCMSFNATSTLLCVSSATETVHIFKLAAPSTAAKRRQSSSHGNGAQAISPPTSPRLSSFSSRDRERSTSPTNSDQLSASPSHLDEPIPSSRQPRPAGLMSLVRRTSQNVGGSFMTRASSYLPTSVTEMWEPQRDFAWVRIPRGQNGLPVKCVVAMASHAPHVMIATNEGNFYIYGVDLEKGGEGTLLKLHDDIHGLDVGKNQNDED